MDTIFAPATARGKAGLAVIRISGPHSWDALVSLGCRLPNPRTAALRRLTDAQGEALDDALVLLFEEGASFTGEKVVELHLHGSTATVAALMQALGNMENLRIADPGEFTRRALENQCLDLAQVEGLADLVEAETEAQRRQALKVLDGAIGKKAETWRVNLIRAAALIEATIDFADEDVPVDVSPEVLSILDQLIQNIGLEISGIGISERIREGFEVAIVGAPNAGKSTLLNALAGREAAITSEVAGTTRDVIEVRMDLRGLPVTILDTAGLRETKDAIEHIGIERAIARAQAADLRVFLLGEGKIEGLDPGPEDIVVHGKSDLVDYNHQDAISGVTGQGIENLINRIATYLEVKASGAATATHQRHRLAMEHAVSSIESARDEIESGSDRFELAAEELRSAIRALDSLVGRIDVEDFLDEIFASFCIGK